MLNAVKNRWVGGLLLATMGLSNGFATPVPTVSSVTVSSKDMVATDLTPPLIGEEACFVTRFDNTSTTATDTGYGPYMDVYLPSTGADGDDGLTFKSATYLLQALQATQLTLTSSGVNHPYAKDSSGNPVKIMPPSGFKAGDTLAILRFPLGSFTADQTPADVRVCYTVSKLADVGHLLPITVKSGFQYGADALDNPTSDPSIQGAGISLNVTPAVFRLNKQYLGPERSFLVDEQAAAGETASGPNYPQQYHLVLDVADGQTLTNVDLTDALPNTIQFVAADKALSVTPSTTAPGGNLTRHVNSVIGTAADNDADLTFNFYAPLNDASSKAVIDAATGAMVIAKDSATASANWTPNDPRDAAGVINATPAEHNLEVQSIAVQKSVAITTDTGFSGYSPGDTLTYTISLQVSDYFAFDNIVVTDVLSNGHAIVPGTYRLDVTDGHAGTSTGSFTNVSVTPNGSSDKIVFNVSQELLLRGFSTNGRLVGGAIPQNGGAPEAGTSLPFTATTATITFEATISDQYQYSVDSGKTPFVDEGDLLSNDVTVEADLLSATDLSTPGPTVTDDGGTAFNIAEGSVAKSIYAINGNVAYTATQIAPGDTVTYRLTYTSPSGDADSFKLTDFLPLPIFNAGQITSQATVCNITSATDRPSAGSWCVTNIYDVSVTPTLSVNSNANALVFNFSPFSNSNNDTKTIDILFTVTVSSDVFADGLFLSNLVTANVGTTNTSTAVNSALAQIQLTEPVLKLTKGVVATNGSTSFPRGQFTAAKGPSGITFNAPGSATAFSGTISSAGLASTPVQSNLTGADANDTVTFALVLENIGTGLNGAFDVKVKDTLPTGFSVPAAGLNLHVTDGAGTSIATSNIGTGLFDGGIELTDGASNGAIQAYDANNGKNIAVITYDLTVDANAVMGSSLKNTATLFNYTGAAGGQDHTTTDLTDTANVDVSTYLNKTVATSSESSTNGATATIGEVVRYHLSTLLPEGNASNLIVEDVLPSGMAFLNDSTIKVAFVRNTAGTDITTNAFSASDLNVTRSSTGSIASDVSPTFSLPPSQVSVNGSTIRFSMGDVINNNDNTSNEFVVIEFNALVSNTSGNVVGTSLTNRMNAYANINGTSTKLSTYAVALTVVEPSLSISKQSNVTEADAGDTVTYTVTITSPTATNNTTAFDVHVTDVLPAGKLSDLAITSLPSTGVTNNTSGNTLDVLIASIAPGTAVSISYTAKLGANVAAGEVITDTTNAVWTSLPGNQGTTSNATGSSTPGNSGDTNGERNSYSGQALANITVKQVGLTKDVFGTSYSGTGASQHNNALTDLTIGEEVTYEIDVTIPEGVTAPVNVTDTLPYQNGVMQLVSYRVKAVGGNLTLGTLNTVQSDAQLSDGIDDTISFNFVNITNTSDGAEDINDVLTLEVVARVVDSPANQDGNILVNTATVVYGNSLNAAASVSTEIVEPRLSVVNSANVSQGDAGDEITYTITVTHTAASTAPAESVVVSDILPTGLNFVAGSCSGCSEAGGTITLNSASLALGDSLTATFKVKVDNTVTLGSTLSTTANLTWQSLPGVRAYAGSDSETFVVTNPGLTQSVTATSLNNGSTNFDAGVPDLSIGEKVTYTVVATLIEGTTPSAKLIYQLPTATVMQVLSAQIKSAGSNISGAPVVGTAGVLSDTNSDGINDHVEWTLGNVTNAGDADTTNDTITFEIVAVVMDDAQNQSGLTDQMSTATLSATGMSDLQALAKVDVVDPTLSVKKTVMSTSLGDNLVTPDSAATFKIEVGHTTASTADSYNVVLTDTLPAGLTWGGDSNANASNCSGLSVDSSKAPVLTFKLTQLPLTSTCTVSYQVQVDANVALGSTLTNTVVMDYDSTPVVVTDQTRSKTAQAQSSVIVFGGSLIKTVSNTTLSDTGSTQHDPAHPDLAIGEQVTYELTVVVPEGGATNGLVVTDLLPVAGINGAPGTIEVIGASVVNLGSGLQASKSGSAVMDDFQLVEGLDDRVMFDFGAVTNNSDHTTTDASDQIVLHVVGRLVSVADNADGDALTNHATAAIDGKQMSSESTIDVVEPSLSLTKAMLLNGNDTVRVTLTLNNNGTAPAYDVKATDLLLAANWNTASVTPVSVPNGFELVTVVDGSTGDATVIFQTQANTASGGYVDAAQAVSVVFDVQLATALANNPLTNTASSGYSSFPGSGDSNDRAYTPVNGSASLAIPHLSATKVVTKVGTAGAGIAPGDTLRYTVVIANSGAGTATDVQLSDTPDSNSTLTVGTITSTLGTVVQGNATSDTGVGVNVGSIPASSSVTITYDVVVNNPLPAGVVSLSNQAIIQSHELSPLMTDDPTVATSSTDPTIVTIGASPDLSVVKTDGGVTAVAGGMVSYSIAYSNVGNQAATGVVITETVPANTSFVANGSTIGWSCPDNSAAGVSCTLAIGNLAAGGSGSATFVVKLANTVPAGVNQVLNTVTIADDGTNGSDLSSSNNSSSTSTLINTASELVLTKTVNVTTALAGDVLKYTLSYANNGTQDAGNVVINDTVPANTAFDVANSSTGWSCADGAVEGTTCLLTVGALPSGGRGERTFAVKVLPSASSGVAIINRASASDSSNSGITAATSNTVSVQVPGTADIQVVKTGPATVNAGSAITYTVAASNAGPSAANGTTVTDNVPSTLAGVTISCTSTGGASCPATSGLTALNNVSLATFPANSSVTFTVNATVSASSGSITNTATAVAPTGITDPDASNNNSSNPSGTVVTAVTEVADMAVTGNTLPTTVMAGSTVTGTMTCTNHGPSAAANATCAITGLPAGSSVNCTPSTPVASLLVNATIVCTISYVAPVSGQVTATLTAGTSTVDSVSSNNTQVYSTSVTSNPPVNPSTPTTTAVPTLSNLGLALLMLLCLGAAYPSVRRKGL